MISFTIEFDKPDKKYKSGDTVYCHIKIVVHRNFKARSLGVQVKGFAHTEWLVNKNGTRAKHMCDQELFESYQFILKQHNKIKVAVGTYHYDVQFNLPDDLPSNFEHFYGHIRYSVEVNYDVLWGFDQCDTAFFNVLSELDLNEYAEFQRPIEKTEKYTFCCFCFNSDPLKIVNVLPKGGFVVGEMIPVIVEVHNNSDVRVKYVKVRLIENLKFYNDREWPHFKSDWNIVNEQIIDTAVKPFESKLLQREIYVDPNYNWKFLNGCRIITCEYFIESEAVSPGCHMNVENHSKITIGTIPFRLSEI